MKKLEDIPYWEFESFVQLAKELDQNIKVTFQGRTWEIKSMDGLNERIQYQDSKEYPFKSSFRSLSESIGEYLGGTDQKGNEYSPSRLKGSICVGENNGDLLFVDSRTGSIAAYYHDGGDIEVLASSYEAFIGLCEAIE